MAYPEYAAPFTCIMTNLPSHTEGGKVVCKSLNPIRNCLQQKGFLVSKIKPIYARGAFLGHAVLEFGMTDDHGTSAFKLHRLFEMKGRSRVDWEASYEQKVGPYLWIATRQDVNFIRRPIDFRHVPWALMLAGQAEANGEATNPYESIKNTVNALYA